MATRPTVTVYNAKTSKPSTTLALPAVFSAPIRPDIVQFVHMNMAKNHRQAYAVSEMAGHQVTAESWGTGRAVARIPRVGGGGTSRSGQGAYGNMCRKGRMFAPTKTWRRWHRRVSVNQKRYAVVSALAASAVAPLVMARGHRIEKVAEIPFVVSSLNSKKTKEAVSFLAAAGLKGEVAKAATKSNRAGAGKMRGRRYVQRRGPLVVHGGDKHLIHAFRNVPGVELAHVQKLNLLQLAPGGHVGRFIIWTQDAFAQLDSVFGTETTASKSKFGYKLPRHMMSNADVSRIVQSDEVQSVVRPTKSRPLIARVKKNPLTNVYAMQKLNPTTFMRRRAALAGSRQTFKRTQAIRKARHQYTKDSKFSGKSFVRAMLA